MDSSAVKKIILLTGFWNFLSFFLPKAQLFCFFQFNIKRGRAFKITYKTIHTFQNLFCGILLAVNLISVSNTRFIDILFHTNEHTSNVFVTYNNKNNEIVENIFIFVISNFLYHALNVGCFRKVTFSEICRSFFLFFFFWSGYCSRFITVTFFIAALSNLFEVFRQFIEYFPKIVNRFGKCKIFRICCSIFSNFLWLYLFGYVVPTYCLLNVLLLDSISVTDQFHFNLFKILFVLLYVSEILHSTIGNHFLKGWRKLRFYPVGFIKSFLNGSKKTKTEAEEREETLKMYTAQGKSTQEIRRQIELMQMVKCVMAIKKKLKKSKENRAKLAENEARNGTTGVSSIIEN